MARIIIGVLLLWVALAQPGLAQEDSTGIANPYRLSIEEDILNLDVQNTKLRRVYATSRQDEKLLATISSAYVVTAEEIKQSGALTIGEALRLVPGVLVKQKTNGYFEVSLRGVAGHLSAIETENTPVLLTINGIPCNDWLQGSIMWETLPIDLHDIMQIEVVTTPNTSFFGFNAVSGVINLVTKSVEEKSLQAKSTLQGSINEDYVHRGYASFGTSDQLKFRVSGHYRRLTRFQDEIFLLSRNRYIQSDSLLYYQSTAQETNVYGDKARRDNGINAVATYRPTEGISLEAIVSVKESYLQSVIRPLDQIALTNRDSKTSAVMLNTQLGNFRTRMAYQSGKHNRAVGYLGTEVHTKNLYAATEYEYVRPVYQAVVGGDINYSAFGNTLPLNSTSLIATNSYSGQVLLGDNSLYHTGAFVNQHLRLLGEKWHLAVALRGDYLNLTKKFYGSYQIGTTYRIGKAHWIRANASSGLGNLTAQNYLRYDIDETDYIANEQLKPLQNKTYELGYRIMPYNDLVLGVTYFQSNFSNLINASANKNSDSTVVQNGVTVDARWTLNKLQTTGFITWQKSESKFDNDVVDGFGNTKPSYFGGVTGNYRAFLNKLRFNAGLYFYGASSVTISDQNYSMPSVFTANCKLSYNVWDQHTVFFNGRNILNNKKIEVPFADQTKSLYMIGINLVF